MQIVGPPLPTTGLTLTTADDTLTLTSGQMATSSPRR
jgi:hypothetical protein